jgi:predicted butyrate kinase (DUF1464 family)
MVRVAGTDPGTSSLDLLVLEDGLVRDQRRFLPVELRADPAQPVAWLEARGPFDLVAGPSGYGLPLVRGADCGERELRLLSLVRPDEGGPGRQGVAGFSAVARAMAASPLPIVFLPGVIHLPTVPAHRKLNRVDLGTADKLCVAALALDRLAARRACDLDECTACVVELGSAFTACIVLAEGRVVDGAGGTSGALGWQSAGAWDGEAAYLLSPLCKRDLFGGGLRNVHDPMQGRAAFGESLRKTIAGLRAVAPFDEITLSGRLLDSEPELPGAVEQDLARLGTVSRLEGLPEAWVKHAAQGAALLADGLAGGTRKRLVDHLDLRGASGSCLDWLCYPRAVELQKAFGL